MPTKKELKKQLQDLTDRLLRVQANSHLRDPYKGYLEEDLIWQIKNIKKLLNN